MRSEKLVSLDEVREILTPGPTSRGGLWASRVQAFQDTVLDLRSVDSRVLEKLVKSSFEEGYVEGAGTGWVNDPKMFEAWRKSRARRTMTCSSITRLT